MVVEDSVVNLENLFPKKDYYPGQKALIKRIYDAILKNRIVLFEGGCGTGKTIVSLVAALSAGTLSGKKIVVATDVHRQMERFVEEAKDIQKKFSFKGVALIGKTHLCPLKKSYLECEKLMNAVRSPTRVFKDEICEYAVSSFSSPTGHLVNWVLSEMRLPEEVYERMKSLKQCPYEIIKRSLKNANLVICNYQHLLNVDILYRVLGWMECALEDLIIIFDEAHNIEAKARLNASHQLPLDEIRKGLEELDKDTEEYAFLKALIARVYEIVEDTYKGVGELPYHQEKIPLRTGDREHLLSYLESEFGENISDLCEAIYNKGIESGDDSPLMNISNFIISYMELAHTHVYFPQLNVIRDKRLYVELELYACLPGRVTRPIFEKVSAAILMSATLQPFDILERVLGIEREVERLSIPSPFPPDHRITIAGGIPPLFAKDRRDPGIIYALKNVLEGIITNSSGNVLIFFPAREEAERYFEVVDTDARKILDQSGSSKEALKALSECDVKCVLFSYLWGTLTEGVDYPGDLARTVVVVGVGYPALNPELKAIISSYEQEFGESTGWRFGVEIPTIRRIRQALGRVIRSPEDYGARILLDYRFTRDSFLRMPKYSVYSEFPADERREMIDTEPENIPFLIADFFDKYSSKKK